MAGNARAPAARDSSTSSLFEGIILGWMIPGLGHIRSGHGRQGWFLLVLIGGTFLAGLLLSEFEAVSLKLHPYAFWAQIGVAGATLPILGFDPAADEVLIGHASIRDYRTVPRFNDSGVLFCSIAGLLNVLALFDLIDRRLGRPGREAPA
ncbi:MAG: DUF6677 family protein [Planctomycetota bacterium]